MKINKDQVIPSRWQKLTFDYKRGSGHLLAFMRNRFRWHYYPRLHYVSRFPDHVDVEISSACNMKCPMCYTITDEFKQKIKRQFMEFDLFKKIIDECVSYGTYSIRLSLRGETFIHKDAIRMIRYAKEKGIREVSTLTNNLALNPALFEEAMKAGLDWLTISFDGLGDTYESIRKPAKFADSYGKIKEYKCIKVKAHSLKPVIKVQSVWPAVKDNAQEYLDAFRPYADDIAFNPLVDYLHVDEDIQYLSNFTCPVLYQRLVIGSDGMALLCSNDEFCMHPVGDANIEPLHSIWHGEGMTGARDIHLRHKGVELLGPCGHCYLPRKTQPVVEHIGDRKIVVDKYINRPDKVGA
ncbi:MAG: radical SAM protein [Nitrospirae bacterium]|nr:radical SAM protein [Nitrospirota bacterium]